MTTSNRLTFYTGSKAITAAGTAEQLPGQAIPDEFGVVIKAKRTNTGFVYIGESKAQAEAHNWELEKKDNVKLYVTNINAIWADVSISGESVEILVEI